MKHYKKTHKRILKHEKWKIKFIEHIGEKFAKANSATLKLRLIHIKRRFFDSGMLELLVMQSLNSQIENEREQKKEDLKKGKIVNLKDFRG